jgi:hypothetical protein
MVMNRGRHGTRGGVPVLLIVTALCLVALWLLVWFLILWVTGQQRNAYVQLGTPQQPVWVQVRGNQMRQAASAADLESAEWVSPRDREWGCSAFAPIDVPSEGMDVGVAVDAARVVVIVFASYCDAEWEYEKRDEEKVRWEYVVSTNLETARSPEEAVLNEPPRLEKPVLEVDAEVGREGGESTIGVSLRLDPGEWGLEEIRRNGRPVEVQVRILDSTGKEVASETGSVEDYGYT